MRRVEELIDADEPALARVREWLAASQVEFELLPPSAARGDVLWRLQVTTRSPLGALAYETGGLLLDGGWLRFLGSGHPRMQRDLWSWNQGRSSGFFLFADDAVGGFFALNGGALGPDHHNVYYWSPDDLDWEPLEVGFTEFLTSFLSGAMERLYTDLRWPGWEADARSLPADRCFAFYPFLWTIEGSITSSHRATVPAAEAFDLKADLCRQLRGA
jgi:hypothetical protein